MLRRAQRVLAERAGSWAVGLPLGATIFGAGDFLFDFPEPLTEFVKCARANTAVTEALGEPIRRSVFWNGASGCTKSHVAIPISGPLGSGTLHGRAIRPPALKEGATAQWQFITLDVVLASGETIEILQHENTAAPIDPAMAAAFAAMHAPKLGEGSGGACGVGQLDSV